MKIKQVLNSVNTKHIRSQLRDHYHRKGPGRKPINPLAMLKAQLLKHLLRIPSDRRLALHLKHDKRAAKACGFRKQTPSHGLFTHFRHRLGQDTYHRIFNQLLRRRARARVNDNYTLELLASMADLDFGIQIEPQFGFTYDDIKEISLEAEGLGFESLWVSDHFFLTKENIGTNCLECYTTLTALARDTTTLRLGPMVTGQNYRSPALLANIAASLDHISGGRLYFGIGAGWKVVEYEAYGYEFPKPMARIRQLEETIEIAKAMWTQEKATYRGRYYSVEDALCYPHPVQKPHVPIWVGGTGYQTLKVSAKHADAINFAWSQPPEFFDEKLGILRKHCERYGRDYDAIRKSAGLMITMKESPEELKVELQDQRDKKDSHYRRYLSRQPPNIADTPEAVADKIGEYVSLGFDHFILRFNFGQEIEKMRLFMDKVRNRI